MSVNKNRPFPVDYTDLDPAVTTAMGDPVFDRIKRARNRTPTQRRKAEKDSQRNRVMFDLPVDLDAVIGMLAEAEKTSQSQMASYVLILGLEQLASTGCNFGWVKQPTRSMRFEYSINLPPIPNSFLERLKVFKKFNGRPDERCR